MLPHTTYLRAVPRPSHWPGSHPDLQGPLELVTAPTLWPVTAQDVKNQCRIDADDELGFLQRLIERATEHCQNECGGRQFMTATWDLPVAGWWCGPMKLPRPPLQSVTSVKYYATDGTQTTLDTSNYEVRTPWKQPGYLAWLPNITLPALQCGRAFPVTVRFVAGFSTAALVPADWKAALLMLAAHWFEHREAVTDMAAGAIVPTPMAVQSLLANAGWGSYA